MRKLLLATAVLCGLAGCQANSTGATQAMGAVATAAADTLLQRAPSAIAGYADHGALFQADTGVVRHEGGADWQAIQVSERHALQAVASGRMDLDLPDGRRLQLDYVRHVEHPDGNWTFVGRPTGAGVGNEAILTFGEKAVFGSIPTGTGEPLEITTAAGRTWLVQGGASTRDALGDGGTDAMLPPPAALLQDGPKTTAAASRVAQAPGDAALTTTTASVVDVVIGYTKGFADRLGGNSQARTRLDFMVAVANQAYVNSLIDLQMVLVGAVPLNYPDATSNRSALFALTGLSCTSTIGGQLPDGGVNCVPANVPKVLQPLVYARNSTGADLMVLVRKLEDPSVQSCGTAWKLGGGQSVITTADAPYGVSVVSDTSGNTFPVNGNTCRDESLAHETGHNFGLQHDVLTAQGNDDTNNDGNLLDPEEYGAFPYSFGYSTDAANGNFYTVMSVRRTGQTGYRVFANPTLTTYCGGFPCGVAGQSDNALSMSQTMPVIASFRNPPGITPSCPRGHVCN